MLSALVLLGWLIISIAAIVGLFIDIWPFNAVLVLIALTYSHRLFKDTLNKVQIVWRVYWITRDYIPDNTPLVSKGFMRETESPWRIGKGVQIRVPKRTIQIGICDKGNNSDEIAGLVYAVGGRLLDDSPHKIGDW